MELLFVFYLLWFHYFVLYFVYLDNHGRDGVDDTSVPCAFIPLTEFRFLFIFVLALNSFRPLTRTTYAFRRYESFNSLLKNLTWRDIKIIHWISCSIVGMILLVFAHPLNALFDFLVTMGVSSTARQRCECLWSTMDWEQWCETVLNQGLRSARENENSIFQPVHHFQWVKEKQKT